MAPRAPLARSAWLALVLCSAGLTLELSACATNAPARAPESDAPRTPRKTRAKVAKKPPPVAAPEPTPTDTQAPPPLALVAPAPEIPAEDGLASYYADSLAGNRTASGERYRPQERTCAHRTHKFGTSLVVTAVDTGRRATCRVNDRGPFVAGRVVDVSRRVAEELGMVKAGVVRVRVEVAADGSGS